MRWLLCGFVLLTASTCCSAGELAAYRLRTFGTDPQGTAFQSDSTCFSVGQLASGGSLLVSAKHCFADADRAQVKIGNKWHSVRKITEDRQADLVAIEIDTEDTQELSLGDGTPGITVDLLGYGSEYNGGKKETLRGRLVTAGQMVGIGGHHAVRGDSGGPVVDVAGRVVGVCSEVQWISTASRSDYAGQNAKTNLVPVSEVKRFLTQYYQQSCGPSGCTIWMGGGVQGYRPQPVYLQPRPAPVMQPQKPTIDSESILRDEVRKWLAANAAALRGKDGKDGRDGVDATADTRPLTVQLRRAGKVFRQQEYYPGDTMFLNVEDLTTGGSK